LFDSAQKTVNKTEEIYRNQCNVGDLTLLKVADRRITIAIQTADIGLTFDKLLIL